VRPGLLVEVAELGVPVGMLGALQGLAGALQPVALLLELPPDGVCGDLEALRAKGVGEVAGGLGRPPQRRLRVAAGVGVDQPVQRRCQARLAFGRPLGPATVTAVPPVGIGWLMQLPGAAGNGGDRDLGEFGDAGHPAAAKRDRGCAADQAPVSLAQVRQDPGQHRRQDPVNSRIAPTWQTYLGHPYDSNLDYVAHIYLCAAEPSDLNDWPPGSARSTGARRSAG
jgi:hypothetical protein